MKQSLQWADGALVKKEVDLQVLELLGPKTNDELLDKGKKKDTKAASAPKVRIFFRRLISRRRMVPQKAMRSSQSRQWRTLVKVSNICTAL